MSPDGIPSYEEIAKYPPNIQQMWYAILGPPPTRWVPEFEPAYYAEVDGHIVELNREYFATQETAAQLVSRLRADHVSIVKYQGAGGKVSSNGHERWLVWADGCAMNAGKLAAYYLRNPEDKFPHVAELACLHDLNDARNQGQKLPAE